MYMDSLTIDERKKVIMELKQRKDVSAVCSGYGFSTQTYWNAMKRTDSKYSDAELLVIDGMYKRAQERMELRKRVGVC